MSVSPLNGEAEHNPYGSVQLIKSKQPINDEKYYYIDSDSDESVVEVPVPPKPKPPVINLDDSNDDIIECITIDQSVTDENRNTLHLEGEMAKKLMELLMEYLFTHLDSNSKKLEQ